MTTRSGFLAALLAASGVASAVFSLAVSESAAAEESFRHFLKSFEKGTERFLNGDTVLWKANASKRADAVIMGAWGAYEKGWEEASSRYDWAGKRFADGGAKLAVEYLSTLVSGDLAVTVAIERSQVKLAGMDAMAPMQLRVTHVFRREDGQWKLVVRHADPLMAKTAPNDTLLK